MNCAGYDPGPRLGSARSNSAGQTSALRRSQNPGRAITMGSHWAQKAMKRSGSHGKVLESKCMPSENSRSSTTLLFPGAVGLFFDSSLDFFVEIGCSISQK